MFDDVPRAAKVTVEMPRDRFLGNDEMLKGFKMRLTSAVVSRSYDGELLVGARRGEDKALAVVEAVGILAGADLLVRGVETAAFCRGVLDLSLGVLVAAASDGADVGRSLALLEGLFWLGVGDGVRGGGDSAKGEGEGGFEGDHFEWRRLMDWKVELR